MDFEKSNWFRHLKRMAPVLVVGLSLSSASAFAYLLYYDVYKNKRNAGTHQVAGVIQDAQAKVRRKLSDRLAWDPVDSQDKLYWNDTIQTAKGSQVKIGLQSGQTIVLGELALVVIEKDKSGLSLKLQSGNLVIEGENADGSVKVNGVTLEKGANKSLSVSIDAKSGKLTATESGEGKTKQLTVDANGAIQETDVPISLVEPAQLAQFYTEHASHRIRLNWRMAAGKRVRLEFSRSSSFSKPFLTREPKQIGTEENFAIGEYFWRAYLIDDKAYSEVRSFRVSKATVPEPLSPLAGARLRFRARALAVDFGWKPSPGADHYRLDVATDAAFSHPIYSTETESSHARAPQVPGGEAYWRVTALYGAYGAPSPSRKITLEQLPSTLPPTNLEPAPDHKVTLEEFEKMGGIKFKWTRADEAPLLYVLSKNKSLENPLVTGEQATNEMVVSKRLEGGDYYWAVGHRNENGEWTYEDIRKLRVDNLKPLLPAPVIESPLADARVDLMDTSLVKWSWKAVEGARFYRFSLARTTNPRVVSENRGKALSFETDEDFEDGRYEWTVVAVDEAGRDSHSTTQTVEFYHGHLLGKLNMGQDHLGVLSEGQQTISWVEQKGAAKYQLEVAKESKFEKPVVSEDLKRTSFSLSLAPGEYHYRLRGVDKRNRPGEWGDIKSFVVVPALKTVDNSTPEYKYVAKIPVVPVEWRSEGREFEVTIRDDKKILSTQTISDRQIRFNPPGAGHYFVSVRTGLGGRFGPAQDVASFAVTKEKIKNPEWESTREEWKSDRPIYLEWTSVEGAAFYRLKIKRLAGPDGREPAADLEPVQISNNGYIVDGLPKGEYVASIEASTGVESSGVTNYQFSVKQPKVIRIRSISLDARLKIGGINYTSQLAEENNTTKISGSQMLGVDTNGLVSFVESRWKARFSGGVSSFRAAGRPVMLSNLSAGMGYDFGQILCQQCEIVVSAGPRVWTVPTVNRSTSAANKTVLDITRPTLLGPQISLDWKKPLGSGAALLASVEASTPLYNSSIGRGENEKTDMGKDWSSKVAAGLQTSMNSESSLQFMIERNHEVLSWKSATGAQSSVDVDETAFIFGLNSLIGENEQERSLFSDFEFRGKYSYDLVSFEGSDRHSTGHETNTSLEGKSGGTTELQGEGWFRESKNGVLAVANWHGFETGTDTQFTQSDLAIQWGRRLNQSRSDEWEFLNYLGAATRTLPIITDSAAGTHYTYAMGAFGVQEGLKISHGIGPRAKISLLSEVFYPLTATMQNTEVKKLESSMCFKSEVSAGYRFSPSVHGYLGGGYRLDQFYYRTESNPDKQYKTILRSPFMSVMGAFSF